MKPLQATTRKPGRAEAGDGERPESLVDAVQQALDEARMVLPGIQALFGFQLIAVFNQRFDTALSQTEQLIHLAALVLVGVAIALIMTPAAYHRQTDKGQVSLRLLRVASMLVSAAMVPLMIGLCLDIYVVAHVITMHAAASAAIAALLLMLIGGLWFVFPQWSRRRPRKR